MQLARNCVVIALALFITSATAGLSADDAIQPIDKRYNSADVAETPDFQRHVMPLLGRLGCNGRACHGSFQGRGGFRLSLFGYDFKADYMELLNQQDEMRVDVNHPLDSLIIAKPTDEDNHEGGQRYVKDSWQYHVIRRWIEAGAPFDEAAVQQLDRLEITPSEIVFKKKNEQIQLQAVAVWPDGTREDVTPLCRFQTNDDQVAALDENGLVTANEPGDTHLVVFYDNAVVPVPVIRPVSDLVGNKYPKVDTPTKVDEEVVAKLRKLGVMPSELCGDAEFLRRVRLDMTGSLPAPEEVKAFLADKDVNKRAKKVDELLETPAYAAWWTTKLCDYTGNNDQQLNNVSPMRNAASQEWYDWIYARVEKNVPYDELAAGIITAKSRSGDESYIDFCKEMSDVYREGSGKSFSDLPSLTHYWARRDFREVEARAIGFAYSFMGIRIQCAQCHKHPFDQWSKDDFHQFKNFFSKVVAGRNGASPEAREEYNKLVEDLGLKNKRGNELRQMIPDLLKQGKTVPFPEVYVSDRPQIRRNPSDDYPVFDHAKLLGGDEVALDEGDPRDALMEWLRGKDNRYFAPALVNRVWASYFNVGIVEPPDDLSLANPPSNKPLLDYLAQGFIENGFDMKWLHRTIANSQTYQRSWKPNDTNGGDLHNFSHAIPRRLPAEVVYDAIQQATGDDEKVAAMNEDVEGRAIAIPGAGYRNNRGGNASYALTVFGRSTRESNCDCDRSMEPSLLQTVFLQNDRETLQLVENRRDGWLGQVAKELNPKSAAKADPRQEANNLRQQMAQIQKKLQRLRQDGQADQAKQLEARLANLRKQAGQLANASTQSEKLEVDENKVQDLVNQAYIRTLSRYPNETELARSEQYITEAGDTINGVRDLMWALINTKEFIVNH